MRDEEVGEAARPAQVEHEVEDLGPDRHVEHGDRLVGDDEVGSEDEGARDVHPLSLAPGQLVRVPEGEVGRRPQPCGLDRLEDDALALGRGSAGAVDEQRLGDEVVDCLLGVERLVRVLEDELDAASVRGEVGASPDPGEVATLEQQAARGGPGELHDDPPGRGLPGPGFADEPDDFACGDAQVDAVYGPHDPRVSPAHQVTHRPADREVDLDPLEAEELRHAAGPPAAAAPGTAASGARIGTGPAATVSVAGTGIGSPGPSPV